MCCGRNISQAIGVPNQIRTPVQRSPSLDLAPRATEAQFEYTGKTALTVVSPLTGQKYRFLQPGARVSAFVPHLKRCG